MSKLGLVTVLIPCYNEEKGIASVIRNIPKFGLKKHGFRTKVIVIDNNSTDMTACIAEGLGVTVIKEERQGKGFAIRRGFQEVPKNTDIVVMVDGDDTYDTKELLRMIEPIESGFAEVIVGSRLHGRIKRGSMRYFNRVGNWFFTFLVRTFYKANITDVCSGFFAWKKASMDKLLPHLKSRGFSIEMEMIIKMARLRMWMFSVPISYHEREGKSTLDPFYDGFRIILTWAKYLFWMPHINMKKVKRSIKDWKDVTVKSVKNMVSMLF